MLHSIVENGPRLNVKKYSSGAEREVLNKSPQCFHKCFKHDVKHFQIRDWGRGSSYVEKREKEPPFRDEKHCQGFH